MNEHKIDIGDTKPAAGKSEKSQDRCTKSPSEMRKEWKKMDVDQKCELTGVLCFIPASLICGFSSFIKNFCGCFLNIFIIFIGIWNCCFPKFCRYKEGEWEEKWKPIGCFECCLDRN